MKNGGQDGAKWRKVGAYQIRFVSDGDQFEDLSVERRRKKDAIESGRFVVHVGHSSALNLDSRHNQSTLFRN